MADSDFAYSLTDHLCAACFGRLLVRAGAGGPRIYRCSNCGAEGAEQSELAHPPICACGSKLGERDAQIRCMPNPRQRPELPGEVVAAEIVDGH